MKLIKNSNEKFNHYFISFSSKRDWIFIQFHSSSSVWSNIDPYSLNWDFKSSLHKVFFNSLINHSNFKCKLYSCISLDKVQLFGKIFAHLAKPSMN